VRVVFLGTYLAYGGANRVFVHLNKRRKAKNRELELNKKISQLEAELEAAMDGLRVARLETEELRSSLMEKKR